MKTLIFSISFFQVAILFSQPPEENKVINSSFNFNSSSPIIVTDSIQLENLNEVEVISTKKPSKNREAVSNSKQDIKSISTTSDKFIQKKKEASNQPSSRSADIPLQEKMDEDVRLLKDEDPNSFEYNLYYYISGNYNVDRETELSKAEELAPLDPTVLSQCVGNAMVKNDSAGTINYLEKLQVNNLLSEEVISYAKDLLLSAAEDQVLITHGFFDSYGVAYQQYINKFHSELTTISLDLMQSESYRYHLAKQGFLLPKSNTINTSYLASFCNLNSDKNIALSMTLPREYLSPIKEFLFPIGLVFEYRQNNKLSKDDLVLRNEKLWNQTLEKRNMNQFQSTESNNLSSNYLPMLLFLKAEYTTKGDELKLEWVEKEMELTARKSGKQSFIKKH